MKRMAGNNKHDPKKLMRLMRITAIYRREAICRNDISLNDIIEIYPILRNIAMPSHD